jgi:hypothetical protein
MLPAPAVFGVVEIEFERLAIFPACVVTPVA